MTTRKAATVHWPEYLIEAGALALFLFSACLFVAWIEHPDSFIRPMVTDPLLRRGLIGLSMGLTAIAIVYSPWGKRSGAHLNPALTLTFYLIGKIRFKDAAFYVLFQFAGGIGGVWLARRMLGDGLVGAPEVNYAVTRPGSYGTAAAFAAEMLISFGLMTAVLKFSNNRKLNRYTGMFAGLLVAVYITLEAPVSGMSMNPARSLGSALAARDWTSLWIYFAAPLLGMLLAAEIYRLARGEAGLLCCKLHHDNDQPCLFRCRYHEAGEPLASAVVQPTWDSQPREAGLAAVPCASIPDGADNGIVICPACGGENPGDAVFCGNPDCHKALGEFRYVLEELLDQKNGFERLADRVASFVSKPHFITLHMLWFILWILLNSGLIGYFRLFDVYPYDLLSFILAIEAIFITGFLLISQNRQTAYSEKRAELDYEINIRSYRKLIELERRLKICTLFKPQGD
ncbi:MAG: aquaporin [Gammaproteobacteria bacterium]